MPPFKVTRMFFANPVELYLDFAIARRMIPFDTSFLNKIMKDAFTSTLVTGLSGRRTAVTRSCVR